MQNKDVATPGRQPNHADSDWYRGYNDYHQGADARSCPFTELWRARNWRAGWYTAQDEDDER